LGYFLNLFVFQEKIIKIKNNIVLNPKKVNKLVVTT
jgi:hypothetical protein